MFKQKTHTAEDTALLAEMATGSDSAFEKLYGKYWDYVLDMAYQRLADLDQAKDVAQEVFSYLWNKAGSLSIKNLPAWLNTVVKNHVFDQLKQHQHFVPIGELMTELESAGESTDALLIKRELVRTYEVLIAELPQQQRIIFNMRYRDNMNPDEIAAKLNISPKTVRNHLGRALLKLKTAFMLIYLIALTCGK